MPLHPLKDRVVVRLPEQETTKQFASGLIVVEDKVEQQQGTVVYAGPDASPIGAGDDILFSKYGGDLVKVDDEVLLMLRLTDIYGIITKEGA